MTDLSDNHTSDTGDDDAQWAAFLADHADELQSIEQSSQARQFEKEAKKRDRKQEQQERDTGTFTGTPPRAGRGPRDAQTSIFDEAPDDHFTPPNPNVTLDHYTKVYGAMLVIGVILLVATLFAPRYAGALGSAGGLLTVIGLIALIARRMQQ